MVFMGMRDGRGFVVIGGFCLRGFEDASQKRKEGF